MAMHSIMIVDDNTDLLHIYANILRHEGYEVFTAETGDECLAQIATVVPDIFLMDVVLPDWNGIDLVREIKNRSEFDHCMIVLLSGLKIDSDTKVEGLAAGAVDYLVRPIPNKEIVAKVKALVKVMNMENSLLQLSLELETTVADKTRELTKTVESLNAEVANRIDAERQVRELNAQLEKKVSERTEALKDAMRELETFSYSISHDLKAPLQRIKGYCAIIEHDYTADFNPELARIFERICHAQETMSQYIDGLLKLSSYSRAEIKLSPVDLGKIAQELIDELVDEHAVPPVTFTTTNISALCDPLLIRFALQNLLGNAVKFSRTSSQPAIQLEGKMTDTETICWVTDNGIGFTGQGEELFTVFKREVSEKEYEGSGIGLAIVKKIINRHGGRVFAESSPGYGTKIGFTIPRIPAENCHIALS